MLTRGRSLSPGLFRKDMPSSSNWTCAANVPWGHRAEVMVCLVYEVGEPEPEILDWLFIPTWVPTWESNSDLYWKILAIFRCINQIVLYNSEDMKLFGHSQFPFHYPLCSYVRSGSYEGRDSTEGRNLTEDWKERGGGHGLELLRWSLINHVPLSLGDRGGREWPWEASVHSQPPNTQHRSLSSIWTTKHTTCPLKSVVNVRAISVKTLRQSEPR